MSERLLIGSLFSGALGLDRAVERAFGAETVWVSDIDKGACKVLAYRAPGVPNLGDITAVDWSQVQPVDIITGGSPCQDISTAGRLAGMTEGTRSNLWVEMREAIRILQPAYVIWENVRGAYSTAAHSSVELGPRRVGGKHRGPALRALGRVLGDLAALGFDAEWHGLRAADVGAPHGRFRVFVLASHPERVARLERPGLRPSEPRGFGWGRPADSRGEASVGLLPTPTTRDHKGRNQRDDASCLTGALLPTPRATCGGSNTETVALLSKESANNGNGMGMPLGIAVQLLPTTTASDGERVSTTYGRGNPTLVGALLTTPRATRGGSSSETVQLLPTPSVADSQGGHERRGGKRGDELLLKGIATHQAWGKYAAAIAQWEAIHGPAPAPTKPGRNGRPKLNPAFAEWMMGAPAGWITDVPGVTDNEALKMAGNGVVEQQAYAALRLMLERMETTA